MFKRLIIYFSILSLFTILFGKLLFLLQHPNRFLAAYGILVTSVVLVVFLVSLVWYKDPYLEAASASEYPKKNYFVSCIVAVRDEDKIIEQCINSFLSQTYPNKEIIFINDGSTDKTKDILDKYASDGRIIAIHMDSNVGKKRALAKGIFRSKGEILAFSDSDSVLDSDAIRKAVEILEFDPSVGGVSGHCRALNAEKNILTKIQDSWYEGQFSIRKAFESVFGAVTCVSGPLAVFRKEAIYNFIPAWENDTFLGEEFRFATDRTLTGFVLGSKSIGDKLKKRYKDSPFVKEVDYPTKDWKIVYSKSAKALTEVPDTFGKFLKQQIRWKKSFIRNIFFTGAFYWKKPILPAVYYYLHVLFVLLGPFIAFRHLIYLPLRGNIYSGILYLAGIVFIGFLFGIAFKIENRHSHMWLYRPLMSLMSTLILSWLVFYSLITIRKKIWSRG